MSAGIDLDLDLVVDHRRDEHRRERRVPAVAGIERRLAHQAVHAGFGAQPTVGVRTVDFDRRALDARDFAGALVDHLGRRIRGCRPSAGTCAAASTPSPALRCRRRPPGCRGRRRANPSRRGTCATVRELRTRCSSAAASLHDVRESRVVLLRLDEVEQFRGVRRARPELVEFGERRIESGALAAERLRLVRRVPDRRIAEFVIQLFEPLALRVVLKGTPSAQRGAP